MPYDSDPPRRPRPSGQRPLPDPRASGWFRQPERSQPPSNSERRPVRPAARPRPTPTGVIPPTIPDRNKERRRMLKAAAWRLSTLLRVKPSTVLAAPDLKDLVLKTMASPDEREHRGEATRLATKIARLRA